MDHAGNWRYPADNNRSPKSETRKQASGPENILPPPVVVILARKEPEMITKVFKRLAPLRYYGSTNFQRCIRAQRLALLLLRFSMPQIAKYGSQKIQHSKMV